MRRGGQTKGDINFSTPGKHAPGVQEHTTPTIVMMPSIAATGLIFQTKKLRLRAVDRAVTRIGG